METAIEYNYPSLVNAAFTSRVDAQKAYDELIYRGYKPEDINVIVSDETRRVHHEESANEKPAHSTMENAGIGSAIGGTAGAIAGAIIAIGTTVAIPGLGIAVAGPLLAALTGAGAGGLTGGIVGALHHRGVPKEHAEIFESSIREGGVIISFTPRTIEDRMEIIEAWNRYGARQLHGNETYSP
ncbi:hypothetical protein GCM10007423_25300 [Dyadobacter endophyticus]|uniref:Heat induced stress protein YflT n=1 Tax=Dyadobacter endophyticus TaxID=1749036 RepID=A0ABQ1YS37_9BACT|nr:hypothetical protein [Dyadobacter endophyticus]GGH34415.1 hypothetical protein GCM10007423_25300 [Dyadobacter endophyticus]